MSINMMSRTIVCLLLALLSSIAIVERVVGSSAERPLHPSELTSAVDPNVTPTTTATVTVFTTDFAALDTASAVPAMTGTPAAPNAPASQDTRKMVTLFPPSEDGETATATQGTVSGINSPSTSAAALPTAAAPVPNNNTVLATDEPVEDTAAPGEDAEPAAEPAVDECTPILYNFDNPEDLKAFIDPNFENNYCQHNSYIQNGELVLRLTSECGPSIGPSFEYSEGTVEARFRTGRTNGVVTSLYLRSGTGPDGDQDEVDIEFVGKDPTRFQTFYWVDGQRGQLDPVYHNVGADASAVYRNYGISYTSDAISWLMDGVVIRTLERSNTETFPSQKQRFKVTLWDGSQYDDWAGKSQPENLPQYAYFDWIKFTPAC